MKVCKELEGKRKCRTNGINKHKKEKMKMGERRF